MLIIKPQIQKTLFWISIACLLILEFVLFRRTVLRDIAPYYPGNFDQAHYLVLNYTLYDKIQHLGMKAALFNSTVTLPTSFIFIPQTIVFFLLFGASRLSALTINFIYFALLQLALTKTILAVTHQRSLAYIMLGLLLLAPSAFFWAGGLFDFRIDFMVFCLYGIFVCCIIQSQIFLNRKWVMISAAVAIYLILLRFITASYIAGLIAGMLALLLVSYYKNKTDDIKTRFKNICLFCLLLILGALPFLWLERMAIYNYYVVNHFLNGEKYIRATQVGVTDWLSNLSYYPKSVITDHIGLINLGLILLFFSMAYALNKKQTLKSYISYFVVIAILIPLAALTSDLSKSPVVGSVMVIPILWLGVWSLFKASSVWKHSRLLPTLAIFIFSLGLFTYSQHFTHHLSRTEQANLAQINNMYNDIGDYMQKKGIHGMRYGSDQIIGVLTNSAVIASYYENKHYLLRPAHMMGESIYAVTKEEALHQLGLSDVFIVNLNPYPVYQGNYPFNISMNIWRNILIKKANKDFIVLGEYHYNNSHLRVYVRPNPQEFYQ